MKVNNNSSDYYDEHQEAPWRKFICKESECKPVGLCKILYVKFSGINKYDWLIDWDRMNTDCYIWRQSFGWDWDRCVARQCRSASCGRWHSWHLFDRRSWPPRDSHRRLRDRQGVARDRHRRWGTGSSWRGSSSDLNTRKKTIDDGSTPGKIKMENL